MRKNLLLFALFIMYSGAIAQTTTDVDVEATDGKYHIKVTKEADGKKTTIDKTYNSLEEMKNDPDLKGIDMHIFDSEGMAFINENGSENGKVKVVVESEGDEKATTKESTNVFVFKSKGSDDKEIHDIEVKIDEDGTKHVYKDGEEIVVAEGDEEIKAIDGKNSTYEITIDESEDGEDITRNVIVKVVGSSNIHVEDVEKNDFSEIPGIDAKKLKLDEFNYYPNPSNGKFTLQFKADKRPTEVKVMGVDGKTVYLESIQSFEGTYNNEIDLSKQKKGIYLLQILQGNKAVNKKIVIE